MDDLIIYDLNSFYKDRIVTKMNNIKQEYSTGKRIFNKYDIEDNYAEFSDLSLDDIVFANCFIEASFTNCNLRNAKFLQCNLKILQFKECDLTNAYFDECAIESINFENSIMEGTEFGTNYAYGVTLVNEY